jgi:hypothetical protein
MGIGRPEQTDPISNCTSLYSCGGHHLTFATNADIRLSQIRWTGLEPHAWASMSLNHLLWIWCRIYAITPIEISPFTPWQVVLALPIWGWPYNGMGCSLVQMQGTITTTFDSSELPVYYFEKSRLCKSPESDWQCTTWPWILFAFLREVWSGATKGPRCFLEPRYVAPGW